MKNIFLPKVMMCIIALFTLILPASAQNTNATDEYKETLKKIMVLSGASATTDDFFQKITSVMKLNAPEKDEAYWNEFSKNWKEKIESKVFEMYMPVYEKHLTLEELKAVAAFYESPVGKKYKEASLIVMRETMPLLVKQLQTETFKVVRSEKSERVKRGEQRLKEYEQKKKRDKELYAQAYMLPSDSIVIVPEEVYEKAYENGMSTSPSLYSIERRKNDTKVTFINLFIGTGNGCIIVRDLRLSIRKVAMSIMYEDMMVELRWVGCWLSKDLIINIFISVFYSRN